MRVNNFEDIKVGDSVIYTVINNKDCPSSRYIVGNLDYPNEPVISGRNLIGLERRDGKVFGNGAIHYWVNFNDDIMVFD